MSFCAIAAPATPVARRKVAARMVLTPVIESIATSVRQRQRRRNPDDRGESWAIQAQFAAGGGGRGEARLQRRAIQASTPNQKPVGSKRGDPRPPPWPAFPNQIMP